MVALRTLSRLAAVGALATMLSTPGVLAAQAASIPFPRPDALARSEAKDPTTARLLGIIPGAGHLYAGERGRAALVAGTFVGLFAFGTLAVVGDCAADWSESDCGSSVLVDVIVPTAIIGTWGFSIWDAGRAAHRTNRRRGLPARLTIGGSGDGLRLGMTIGLDLGD